MNVNVVSFRLLESSAQFVLGRYHGSEPGVMLHRKLAGFP
jgi:hypothetical protein